MPPPSSTTAQGTVELATSAETITATDPARAVTPAGLGAKLARFTSSNQTITLAGSLTIAHGLGSRPFGVIVEAICLTAELGYSINDIVIVDNGATSGVGEGISIVTDATNINVRYTSSAIAFQNKTTGAYSNITLANWRYIFKAWL